MTHHVTHHRAATPESSPVSRWQSLLGEVIETAIKDARKYNSSANADEAWSFLTAPSGAWAQSRRDLCDAAGVDADWLRESVLREIPDPAMRRREVQEEKRRRKKVRAPVTVR